MKFHVHQLTYYLRPTFCKLDGFTKQSSSVPHFVGWICREIASICSIITPLKPFNSCLSRQGCIKCAKCFLSIRFPLCLWLKLFETDDIQLTRVNSFFAFVISRSVQEYVNRDKFSFNIIKNGNATRQEAFFWGPLVKALEDWFNF